MRAEIMHECANMEEIQNAVNNLDVATMGDIKFDDGGVLKDVENFRGIYNVSKGKFCTAVIPHYNLIQHKEYFMGFAEALNRLDLKYNMTITQSGNRAFADIDFLNENIKYDKLNEEFMTGIRLVNSYDKSTGIYAVPRFTRLACTNGMIVSRLGENFSVKHHSKLAKDIQAFTEMKISEIINSNKELEKWVTESMKDSTEWLNACYILEKLFKQMKHREAILKELNISIIEIKDEKTKKKSVSYVYEGDEKNKKLTRWEIYNAVTSHLTHSEQITPHIQNLFHKKAEKLLDTSLDKMPKVEVTLTV